MGVYEAKDLTVELPEGWSDRTVVAFSPPQRPNRANPSFVITREPLNEGDTLRTFAARQFTELVKGLRNFTLRESRDVSLGEGSAPQYEFTWTSPHGPLFQQMTFTLFSGTVILFTASAPQHDVSKVRDLFDKMLASVKFHEPPPPGGAGPTPSAPPGRSTRSPTAAPQAGTPPKGELPPDWWPGSKR